MKIRPTPYPPWWIFRLPPPFELIDDDGTVIDRSWSLHRLERRAMLLIALRAP